jgi:endoglucanase
LASVPAPIGHEQALADTLMAMLPGATRDRAGDVTLTLGRGTPRRLVACPMDEPGWIVGGIRDDGYLTVRRLPGRTPPLFDQHAEGQRIVLLGDKGPVPGVVGVRSVHLTRGRSSSDEPFTFDDAFVDVGAASADEVAALGIRVTTPFVLAKAPEAYGKDLLAAPSVGARAACAALVRAASARPRGTVVIAFVVEEGLSGRGLLTVGNEAGPFDETIVLDAGGGTPGGAVAADSMRRPRHGEGLGKLTRWRLRDRFDGWPAETVSLEDVAVLEQRLRDWIGGKP